MGSPGVSCSRLKATGAAAPLEREISKRQVEGGVHGERLERRGHRGGGVGIQAVLYRRWQAPGGRAPAPLVGTKCRKLSEGPAAALGSGRQMRRAGRC
jgi:hypothetical protein